MYELNESRNRRILVIDDNDAIHQDFRKILTADTNCNLSHRAVGSALDAGI